MQSQTSPYLALLLFPLAACVSGGAATSFGGPTATTTSSASTSSAPLEKHGIVAPVRYDAIVLWPEQYAGGFSVLEVLPHGAAVQAGDVIAKLDARAIDEELQRNGLEVVSSKVRHEGVVERNELDAAAAELALEQSKASLERAKRALEGFKKFELTFDKRQDDLSKRYEQANIDDQVDELDQLDKMYKRDDLVDPTEDIVVKRSKRQLETTRIGVELSRDRAKYHEDFEKKLTLEQREEALHAQEAAHARFEKQQQLDARARGDAQLRSAAALREQQDRFEKLQRDRTLLEIRAPRSGVLLHGSSKDFRPGRNPPRYERTSSLAPKMEVFLVADPEAGAVTVDVNDTELAQAKNGARVAVQSLVDPTEKTLGTLSVDTYPRSASPSEATYEARVILDAPFAGVVYGTRAKLTIESAKVDG
jgi:hypothetical protein